ncbi:MAG: Holliday junction branch migration protein RuvA [Pseudomonadota bacterium]|jgi:Holliday junction DNA helicase RuvA
MIGRLQGQLAHKHPPQVLVDCHGVGYELDVPMSTFYHLPELGQTVTLLTHLSIREDAHVLYGFGTEAERQAFRLLIKTSGVGPKMALSVLSGMTVTDLAQAIEGQQTLRLTKVPGIGKKTAERLLLELKDKFAALAPAGGAGVVENEAQHDILQALLALGYNDKEALAALKTLPAGVGVSEGIKLALRGLNR